MSKTAWLSRVDFRSNPAEPKQGIINLGFVLEFTTSDSWVVGTVIVAALDPKALSTLDELSRQILENRKTVIEQEVRNVLGNAEHPGDVVSLLATANPWSLHVSAPEKLEAPSKPLPKDASIEKIAEKFALSFFMTNHKSAENRKSTYKKGKTVTIAPAIDVPDMPIYTPAPWILPPSLIIRPYRR